MDEKSARRTRRRARGQPVTANEKHIYSDRDSCFAGGYKRRNGRKRRAYVERLVYTQMRADKQRGTHRQFTIPNDSRLYGACRKAARRRKREPIRDGHSQLHSAQHIAADNDGRHSESDVYEPFAAFDTIQRGNGRKPFRLHNARKDRGSEASVVAHGRIVIRDKRLSRLLVAKPLHAAIQKLNRPHARRIPRPLH